MSSQDWHILDLDSEDYCRYCGNKTEILTGWVLDQSSDIVLKALSETCPECGMSRPLPAKEHGWVKNKIKLAYNLPIRKGFKHEQQ